MNSLVIAALVLRIFASAQSSHVFFFSPPTGCYVTDLCSSICCRLTLERESSQQRSHTPLRTDSHTEWALAAAQEPAEQSGEKKKVALLSTEILIGMSRTSPGAWSHYWTHLLNIWNPQSHLIGHLKIRMKWTKQWFHDFLFLVHSTSHQAGEEDITKYIYTSVSLHREKKYSAPVIIYLVHKQTGSTSLERPSIFTERGSRRLFLAATSFHPVSRRSCCSMCQPPWPSQPRKIYIYIYI